MDFEEFYKDISSLGKTMDERWFEEFEVLVDELLDEAKMCEPIYTRSEYNRVRTLSIEFRKKICKLFPYTPMVGACE